MAVLTADTHQIFPQDDQFAKDSTYRLSGRLLMAGANGVAKKSCQCTRQPSLASSQIDRDRGPGRLTELCVNVIVQRSNNPV